MRRITHNPSRPSTPEALAKTLAPLARWPESWKAAESDLSVGRELVAIFGDFLTELYLQGLSTRTINRHRANLWVLGGELIRQQHLYPLHKPQSALRTLAEYTSSQGGPLLPSGTTESEQRTFDATCRNLFDFLPEFSATTSSRYKEA
jgi:hypothetical protein